MIPLAIAMIIMCGFLAVCIGYSYLEAEVFFADTKVFGLVNKSAYATIEGIIARLLGLIFFIRKRNYTLLLYLIYLQLL